MKSISKLFIILSFLSFSQSSWANNCLANAASDGTLDQSEELDCINGILASSTIPTAQAGFISLANARSFLLDPNTISTYASDNAIQEVSTAAARVFYSDSLCGNASSPNSFCESMRVLSTAHQDPSNPHRSNGSYYTNFDCNTHASGHPSCRDYVGRLYNFFKTHSYNTVGAGGFECATSVETRLYCDDIISDFLQTAECNGSQTETACETYVTGRFAATTSGPSCLMSHWSGIRSNDPTSSADMSLCTGGPAVGRAAVPPIAGPSDPTPPPAGDDTTNPPPAADPNSELPQLADNIANEVFGGMPGNFSQANLDATTQVPGVDPRGPGGAAISAAETARVGAFNPGANTTPPGIVRAFPSTRGEPGGTPKAGGGSPGGGGPGGGGLGGAGGLGNNNAGGAARGGGNPRGGGGGVSRYGNMAKSMNNGFIGTDGAPAGGSGTPTKERESAVDRQVKQAIAANNRNKIDRDALQRALNRNLGRAGNTQDLVMRSSYFPGHSEVYLWLHQRSDVLDEQGK